MNADEPLRYLTEFGQVREEYREDVLERASDQLMTEGYPPSVLLASHLLVGAYLERQDGEMVQGEPRDPDTLHTIRGINLTRARAGQLAVRLADVINEVIFPEERKPDKTEPYVDTTNNVSIYLQQLGRVERLSPEEQKLMGERIRAGYAAQTEIAERAQVRGKRAQQLHEQIEDGQNARNELVTLFLPLGVKIAKSFQGRGVELPDLIQAANENLLQLATKWDPSKGAFTSYVMKSLPRLVNRDIANNGRTIRLPVHVHDELATLRRSEYELAMRDIKPTAESIGRQAGWDANRTRRALAMRDETPTSVTLWEKDDAVILPEEADDFELGELPMWQASGDAASIRADDEGSSEEASETLFATAAVEGALAILSEREAGVVRGRFGLTDAGKEMTLVEVGRVYGLSIERIRQIEKIAMSKLRHPSVSDALRGYFGIADL